MIKKKVAIALGVLSPYWYDLFEKLVEKNYDIKIFISTHKQPNRDFTWVDYSNFNYKVKKSKNIFINLGKINKKSPFIHLPIGLFLDLIEFKPDVILSSQLGFRTILAIIYGKLFGVPVIPWLGLSMYTERGNSNLRNYIRRIILKLVPCVCTNMADAIKYVHETLNVPLERIFSTPYTIDVVNYSSKVQNESITNNILQNHKIVFLYVGQMVERKGILNLVNSLTLLNDIEKEKCSFSFIGGKLSDGIIEQLDSMKITFQNKPFIIPDELYREYALADVFIFPTLEDEWGVVLHEAAAAKLPIISSIYAGATKEFVSDGLNGYIFDPLDANQIYNAIKKIIETPKIELINMGSKSYNLAKHIDVDFTASNMCDAFEYASKY